MAAVKSGRTQAGNEIIGGTVGGMLQALVGHPLDLIKTRLQRGGYTGTMHCLRQTLQMEGVRGFYKGVSSPIVGSSALCAALFGINGTMKRLVAFSRGKDVTALNKMDNLVVSVLTAPFYTAVVTPFEFVKCQLAYRTKGGPSALSLVADTMRREGISGVFRGYTPTTMMRVFGLPAYFGVYSEVKGAFVPDNGTEADLTSLQLLLAGGLGGVGFWSVIFPFDSVKTKMQTSMQGEASETASLSTTARSMFREGGVRSFYRGFGVCLVRAFPANAATFFGYEVTLRYLNARAVPE